jgi:PAS domain S-box-containing protein
MVGSAHDEVTCAAPGHGTPLVHGGRTGEVVLAAVDAAGAGLWAWDLAAGKVSFAPEWRRQLGYAPSDTSDHIADWVPLVHPDDLPRIRAEVAGLLSGPGPQLRTELRVRHQDGSWRWIQAVAGVVLGGSGAATHLVVSHSDITEHKRTVAELARSNRALRMLSDSNQALIRATEETALLHDVCRIAVAIGGYRMAWVGYADAAAPTAIRRMAHVAAVPRDVTASEVGWPDGPDGRGPAATAVATGSPCIARDAAGDATLASTDGTCQQRGYRSAIALPLCIDGSAMGVLEICSAEADAFDVDEIAVLTELAGDLAFGINTLRIRAERDRATEALRDSNRCLEAAQRVAHVGHWTCDLVTNHVDWSDETYRILGRIPGQPPAATLTLDEQRALVHPDDWPRVARAIEEAITNRKPYEVQYRVVRSSGEIRTVHGEGLVEHDAVGQPRLLFGVIKDITARTRAEDSLRDAERQLSTIIDGLPDFVSRFDRQGRFVYVSGSILRATGAPAEALIGRTPVEMGICTDPRDDVALQESLARVASDGHPEQIEVMFRLPGGPRTFDVRHIAEKDGRGDVVSVLGIARDVTDRKAAERQLYLLNTALDNVGEGIFLMEGDSPRFHYVNHSAAESLGYSRAELTGGMGVFDIDPDWDEARWCGFLPELRERRRLLIRARHRTRDGRIIPIDVTGNYFHFEGQAYNLAIVRDISERLAAESALRESEELYRSLVTAMAEGVVVQDAAGTIIAVNPAAAHIESHSSVDVVRVTAEASAWDVVHEDGAPFPRDRHPSLVTLRTGEPQANVVMGIRRHDGARAWISVNSQPLLRAGEPRPHAVVTTFHDITALRDSERQLRTLTENSPDLILRLDRAGRCCYANGAFERLAGRDQLLAALGPDAQQVLASGAPLETDIKLPLAPGRRAFNVRLIPESDGAARVGSVLAVIRDVTDQVHAQEASRTSEERLREVTEAIDEVFWLRDAADGRFIYVSSAYERVFGRCRDHLYADPDAWLDPVHPEDRARVAATTGRRTDGSDAIEYRIVGVDGVVAWIHERAFPVRDASGQIRHIAGVADDITQRRHLEEQLRQSQKMDAVGQLAGGIAHDFNNMLAVIQMQCSLLMDNGDPRAMRDGLQEVVAATERAANLTRQLLTFSRRQVARPVDIDIGETIGATTRLLQRVLGENVDLDTRLAPGLPLVHADAGMMEQVLMNLAINARDAMHGGGRLSIRLEAVTVDAARAVRHPGAAPGPYVCLSVSDTGCGIPAEDLPRIFEPFFTTKPVGKGTGLGLATVFGIVHQHRGWIDVQSTVGRGTTFSVFLPACTSSGAPRPAAARPRAGGGGDETILLVEDEPAVRAVSRLGLQRYGYRVIEAESAARALEVWAAAAPAVDLLLTDLIMPGASGSQLAAELLARAPGLKVIYTSGYSPEVVDRQLRLEPGCTLLQKPYTIEDLAASVRRSLDAAADERTS